MSLVNNYILFPRRKLTLRRLIIGIIFLVMILRHTSNVKKKLEIAIYSQESYLFIAPLSLKL